MLTLLLRSLLLSLALLWSNCALSASPDNTQKRVINNIIIIGNEVTKPHIIHRELTFGIGDTLTEASAINAMNQSRQNLLNTFLFNFVNVEHALQDSTYLTIVITVTERWYTWPFPIFELAETNFNTWWLTKDFNRVNYGAGVFRRNFRGRNETLYLRARFGYANEYTIHYRTPYVNKKQTLGIGGAFTYVQSSEIAYSTFNNKRLFYSVPGENVREEWIGKVSGVLRQGIFTSNTLELRYTHSDANDSIPLLMPDYFVEGDHQLKYFSLLYSFRYDRRDLKAYPLKGHFINVDIIKNGIGMVSRDELNSFYTKISLKKYWQLGNRTYFASGLKARLTPQIDAPYYLQEGLGYSDIVRGYEYYVIDGQQYGVFKSNFKFQLVAPKVRKMPLVKTDKFRKLHYSAYLNLFADVGYVDDNLYFQDNPLANDYLTGTGIGLDFVTYYDVVLRFEYTINKLGEHGFFIHFTQPI